MFELRLTEQVYLAASSNRNENNISCKGKYILYSRSRCPILYDIGKKEVVAQLHGHSDEVNGQCFVENQAPEELYILSTSHDKSATIWKLIIDKQAIKYEPIYNFKSPDNNVFSTRSSLKHNDLFLSVTTTLDEKIYLWNNDNLVQTVIVKYCCLDSKFFTIQVSNDLKFVFFFIAGTDNKVHIFQLHNNMLIHLLDLTGFSDWVKNLDTLELKERKNEFLLATASQDYLVRVWHMRLINYEEKADQIRTSSSKPLLSTAGSGEYRLTATLETVLSGHNGFVHGLCWFKKLDESILKLITCSADKTIIIWKSSVAPIQQDTCDGGDEKDQQIKKYDQNPASNEIWTESCKVGETGETNLPFLGVCLSDDEKTFYAQSLRGAIHSWNLEAIDGVDDMTTDKSQWKPGESITGHHDSVTDLSWDRGGKYLLSAALDKTCRLHAISSSDGKWHEICRPQVHGHEINCLVSLNFSRFATGAEEKSIRVFGATQFFNKNFEALTNNKIPDDPVSGDMTDMVPAHAQLPALGLSIHGAQSPYGIGDDDETSNKKQNTKNNSVGPNNDWYEISDLVKQLAQLDHLISLPFEEILLQSTLWWETNKLFGHSNELHALTCDSSGKFLASACKANRADLACIIVWETLKFRKIATIEHHTLTITRLKFSPNDKYLLSVSRDRTWCICERDPGSQLRNAYRKLVGTSKTNALHERIIWDCCWTYDSKYFLTVSRDKKAILWSIDNIRSQQLSGKESIEHPTKQLDQKGQSINSYLTIKQFDCSIQAADSPLVDLCGSYSEEDKSRSYLFVLGFEDGSIELHSLELQQLSQGEIVSNWNCLRSIKNFHQLSIKRLAFRPYTTEDKSDQQSEKLLLLASCADDCVVKLTKFTLV